jgi:hypothetical protein
VSSFVDLDVRVRDMQRHIDDLRRGAYEQALERPDKEAVFQRAFELATPVALRVLERVDRLYLAGTGSVSTTPIGDDGEGGLIGSWDLTWPLLERAVHRFDGQPMPPVRITAMYPLHFSHGHISLYEIQPPRRAVASWPFQVVDSADAERQEVVFSAIAEADLHERVFAADVNWRVLPGWPAEPA